MILCDIGNTNADFYHDGKIWSLNLEEFDNYIASQKVYYINVNPDLDKKLIDKKNFIDIRSYFHLDTIYQGMGIDRVAACYTIEDGIVIDAGSAITVDVMSNSMHLGGYILPGLSAYSSSYKDISEHLAIRINPNVILDALPQKTGDAVSYGIVKSILMMLSETCKNKNIFFTGGDGNFFSKFFKNFIFVKSLVFRVLIKEINEKVKIDKC